jgi:uncharacterized protein YkwD
MFINGAFPLQTTNKSLKSLPRVLMGLAASLAVTSQVQAQQYYYYPRAGAGTSRPQYYYTQPVAANRGYYTLQYPQPTYAAQPVQNYYTPQNYQPTQEPATTAGSQIIQTGYTTPVDTAATQPAEAAPASYGGDPYGFMAWLNSTRASYGLGPVNYDANLANWAAMNNSQQQARGLGHFVMGPARRQNSAAGGVFPGAMWMASPAHRAALLDPTITWFGIAAAGAYWTFNAY